MPLTLTLADESASLAFAQRLAAVLTHGLVIYLSGDLGAGKTTLVRGVLQGLGYLGRVKSPTYTLLEPYEMAGFSVRHFDLYRMNDPQEWDDAGFRDEANAHNILLIEWPEQAGDLLPAADLILQFDILASGRILHMTALSPKGEQCLSHLQN
ncbi:MAG: tRNA (adenosine(37)-N6)-threonylcarbamoyltransferase complex ATPase subunit type 1 TsaE [Gallionella sp.]